MSYEPGFYRTQTGYVIRIVPLAKVTSRWRPCPYSKDKDPLPYRIYGNGSDKPDVFGWVPGDYPLKPTNAPRAVAAQMRARAKRLDRNLGRTRA